jgi:hypothetical protein
MKEAAAAAAAGEQANASIGKGPEYLMCQLTVSGAYKLLEDPNVFIADTAATVSSTPHERGMINARMATEDDAITVGNGASAKAANIAESPVGHPVNKRFYSINRKLYFSIAGCPLECCVTSMETSWEAD